MRIAFVAAVAFVLSGCMDLEPDAKSKGNVSSPAGLAPAEDVANAGEAVANGNGDHAADVPPEPAPVNSPKQGGGGGGSIIGKTTGKVVDAKVELKKPHIVVHKKNASASDPLSVVGGVYTRAASFVGSIPLKQWVETEKALNGEYPSHEELMAWMKKNPAVKLPLLSPFQMYGYDSDKGTFLVLEDTEEKARIYKKAGIK